MAGLLHKIAVSVVSRISFTHAEINLIIAYAFREGFEAFRPAFSCNRKVDDLVISPTH